MNEEIIIDGVNVAGCEFFDYECSAYRQEYWESEDNTKDMCSSHPDCYYKQLKRLEQENKDLKDELNKTIKEYNYFNKACVEANTKNIELQRENEILKKKLDIAVGRSTTHGEAAEKYWAALEEIREIVNQSCDNCKYNKDDITCSIGDCGEGKLKIIENKIDEVLTP